MAAVSQTNDVELPAQRDILQIRIEEKDKSEFTIWLHSFHDRILTSFLFYYSQKKTIYKFGNR